MSVPTQEELVRKLELMPLDKLQQLLNEQLDLEVQLKHKELQMADREIGKCDGQMVMLRKFFDIPHDARLDGEPHEFAIKYFDVLNQALTVTYDDLKAREDAATRAQQAARAAVVVAPPTGSVPEIGNATERGYRTRLTTLLLRPVVVDGPARELGCLYRRTDGVIVQVSCVDCGRANFALIQQVISHSRNAHLREYASQDEAALRCGRVIVEVKQDSEGEALIQALIAKGLNPNHHLNLTLFLPEGDEPAPKRARPAPRQSSLLKKMAKEQHITKEQFQQLISDAKAPVGDAHLFDGEVDASDSEEPRGSTPELELVPVSRGQRKSRLGMTLK